MWGFEIKELSPPKHSHSPHMLSGSPASLQHLQPAVSLFHSELFTDLFSLDSLCVIGDIFWHYKTILFLHVNSVTCLCNKMKRGSHFPGGNNITNTFHRRLLLLYSMRLLVFTLFCKCNPHTNQLTGWLNKQECDLIYTYTVTNHHKHLRS